MIRTNCVGVILAVVAMVFVADTVSGDTIIKDTFSRGGLLDGSTPDISPGTSWVVPGGSGHSTDGALLQMIDDGANSRANLGFALNPGLIYTLSADLNINAGGGLMWFAMGFTTSLNDDSSWHEGLHSWMLLRSDDHLGGDIGTLIGPNIGGVESFDVAPFTNEGTMKIVLDTTNAANYKATFLFNDDQVRVANLGSGPAITGVFVANSGHTGSFDNFELIDNAITGSPEPTTMGLLAFGGLAILKRRRKA